MAKPVILTVDDEPQVLNAVERDLRRHFGQDYRIIKANSGAQALDTVRQLKQRNDPVALFLADQRMPGVSGTEFLSEAIKYYPDARKVLLTAYADTEAAITSINSIGLDYYLLKPWDPPEQNLYPVLDDLLGDWTATAELPYEGIRVAGTLWSANSHAVKDFLAGNQIPYQWIDIEQDKQTKEIVDRLQSGGFRLPVVFFPDGSYLIDPGISELAEKAGLKTKAAQPFYDLIIIGGGPAGLAAAVYGGSEGLNTVLIEKQATGGQAGTSSRIENYLGFPKGLSGADLARRAVSQAKRFGVEILVQEAASIRAEGPYRYVRLTDGSELTCHALLVATGVSVRRLEVPGIDELTGAGVYYGAALTEAAYYRDQDVFVIGGANSAGQAAVFFSRYAHKVTMLVRGSSLEAGMSQYLVDQIRGIENVDVLLRTEVLELIGGETSPGHKILEAVVIQNKDTEKIQRLPAAALFIFIGAQPHSEIFKGKLDMDRSGFILTGQDMQAASKNWRLNRDPFLLETNIPGVFAAGDVRHGSVKRVASAVGEGAVTVAFVHQYLKTV